MRRFGTNAGVGDYYNVANKTPQYDPFTYNPGLQPLYDNYAGYPAATRVLRHAYEQDQDLAKRTQDAIAANQAQTPSTIAAIPQAISEGFRSLRSCGNGDMFNSDILVVLGLIIVFMIIMIIYQKICVLSYENDLKLLKYHCATLQNQLQQRLYVGNDDSPPSNSAPLESINPTEFTPPSLHGDSY